MSSLAGKTALVTGAARGIGAACAESLANQGARVVLTDVLTALGEETAAALRAKQHSAIFQALDVTQEAAWDAAIARTIAEFGRLDILVNNAGISIPRTIEDLSLDEFRHVLDVNLLGCFLGTKKAIQSMKTSGGGAIINLASNSTQSVVPLTASYSPSKAAVANLSKVAAIHCAVARYNIRVISIHPGPIETDMLLGGAAGARATEIPQVKQLIDAIPLGRMGKTREIGDVVAFLASDAASYMTAAEIFIDGGLTVSLMK